MGNWLSRSQTDQEVLFLSLGMVVLDELRFPSRPPITDVVGGSGAYATLGNRLFAGVERTEKVGCLVLAGKDFPQAVENQLRGWDMAFLLRKDPNKPSTRGLLEYEDTTFGPKKFKYLTDPLKPTPKDLVDTPLLRSQAIHVLATPQDVQIQISELLKLRQQHGIEGRPFIVWEPIPAACKAQDCKSFLDACKHVDVFSPNHFEMTKLFQNEAPDSFRPEDLESYAQTFLQAPVGPSGHGCIVIRAGEHGSLTVSRSQPGFWSPPFYKEGDSEVIDPTGAGNAYLGGFIAGWQQCKSLVEAASYGNVAASFALQQIGLPTLQKLEGYETWNGIQSLSRLEEYKARLKQGEKVI